MSHKIFRFVTSLFLALALTIIASGPQPARAAGPWYVTPIGDDTNDCLTPGTACATINGAIGKASSGDTIYVSTGTYTGVGNEVVLLDKDATLSGGWDANFTTQNGMSTIDGQAVRQGMLMNNGTTVVIEQFTVQNGFSNLYGGGIYTEGELTLNNSTITGNTALQYGGGISFWGNGALTINNSTISDNTAGAGGGMSAIPNTIPDPGAITLNKTSVINNHSSNGAGIWTRKNLVLNNSAITDNTASEGGGGIYNLDASIMTLNNTTITGNQALNGGGILLDSYSGGGNPDNVTILNSTLSNNTAQTGGGINLASSFPARVVTVRNSIIAKNTASSAADCLGSISTSDHNILGNTTDCSVTAGTGDQFNVDPLLSAFLPAEGYHPLLPTSPAIDAGNLVTCLATDQRGITRPQGIGCDIGSYEYVFTTPGPITSLAVLSGSGQQLSQLNIAFPKPLRVVALDDQGNRISGVTVTFTAPGSGASGTFADTGTNTTTVDTDAGGVATTSIFTANDLAGAYTVSASAIGVGSVNFNLEQVSPPANDNFADAEAIALLPFAATVDITDTTNEPDEPQYCSFMPKTVWYSFTPTETMVVRADTFGSSITGNVNIYTPSGPGISGLTFLGCSINDSLLFSAEVGQTYFLQAGSPNGEVGSVQINLEQIVPPANDNFVNTEDIASLPFTATVDITGATNEPGEHQLCNFMERTVWYSFTPTENMALRADTFGGAVTGAVSIYLSSGPEISDLSILGCSIGSNSFNFFAEAGKTYFLQAGSPYGEVGSVQINLEQIFPPANDNFADAEATGSLPFTATVDITDALIEPDEPVSCVFMPRTVWYSFTPTENMALRADTVGGAITGNVNVYLSSGPGISDLSSLGCSISRGSFIFYAEAGATYYLQAGSPNGEVGNLQINLEQVFPPANDNFDNPQVISSLPFSATVDITNATDEPSEQQICSFMERTVWYSFTPTENIALRADTLGGAITGNVNVYLASGSGVGDLTFLGCSTNSGSFNFYAEAGKTYYLQVGSASFGGQVGSIQINLEQIFPPANDNFADAEAIVSLPLSSSVDITNATNEIGEPNDCTTERTVWFAFTPAESVIIRADTQGSAISGVINIYRAAGSGVSDLEFIGCASPGNSATFMAEAGQRYYFQAGLAYGGLGSIQINLNQLPPVENDDFANAVIVDSLPFSDTRDTSTATSASDDPIDCHNNGSAWYQFTPPSDTTIAANTFGSDYDTTLAVYTGSHGALELVPGGCNDDFSGLQSFVEFEATGGTTYYFMLGFCCGNGGAGGGNLVFSIEGTTPPSAEVTIDIKPGSRVNPINPRSSGKIPVAILSTPDFNAPLEVDRASLTFGSTGNEHSLVSCNRKGTDVNGDGLKDLMCHFKTKLTAFKFGDTEGILKGQTLSGLAIEARDVVRVLHASYP